MWKRVEVFGLDLKMITRMFSLDAESEEWRLILVKLLNKINSECEELLETINDKTKKKLAAKPRFSVA